jgi:DNA-binding CsgD family transcriptional regulator
METRTKVLSASFDRHPPGLADSLAAFAQLMHQYAPFRFDPSVNGGRPYSMGDFFTKPQLRDLDIYQEVHRPLGFDDHCFVHVPSTPGPDGARLTIFLGLFRGSSDFSERDKELLARAQVHLSNARHLAMASTAAREVPLSPDFLARVGFTRRECDVVYWLTQGKSNSEIAFLLHVRTDTVSRYLNNIFERLGVENRVAAVVAVLDLAKRAWQLEQERLRGGAVTLAVPATPRR